MLTSFELIRFYIQSGILSRLTPAESLTLLTIASSYSHISGCSFPSQDYIAEKTGLSRQHVNECVKKLKGERMIFIEKVKRSNKYHLPHADMKNFNNKKMPEIKRRGED
jgi:biotin operon repressor